MRDASRTHARTQWQSFDLATRFAISAAAIIVLLMSGLAWWVSARIERGVIDYAVSRSAQQFDTVVEPAVQDLVEGGSLSDTSKAGLRRLLEHRVAAGDIVGLTVWSVAGDVVFNDAANRADVPPAAAADFEAARDGTLSQGLLTTVNGTHRLQVASALHETASGRVIAFARLYEDAEPLTLSLRGIQWQTGLVVCLLSLSMIALLFNSVRQASRTIAEQRQALADRVETLSAFLQQNSELQASLQEARRRSTTTNDRALRRIGAELHDGPVQLVALALLRLETLRRPASELSEQARADEVDAIESALRDALKEIRDLSSGLALPNLEGLPVAKALEYAVMNHERRSRTRVKVEFARDLPLKADISVLACAYRLVQESLNNAVRHAAGKDQIVKASIDGGRLKVEIADAGPGFAISPGQAPAPQDGQGLGLIGLRDRVESLGGTFEVKSEAGVGTTVIATVDLAAHEAKEAA